MAQRPTRHRNLSFFSALFPFLGGKRRLCPLIFREIDKLVPRRQWHGMRFLDGFMGGGSVSLFAKAMGFDVTAVDIAARGMVVGKALIENSRVKLTYEDVLRLLAPSDDPPGRIEREMVPAVFTQNMGRFVDRAMDMAESATSEARAALLRMLAVKMAMAEHPMSEVRKGTIHRVTTGEFESITESCLKHYIGGLTLTRPKRVWHMAQQINSGVFQGSGRVIQSSIFDALLDIDADVAYFDPPYPGVMSYERKYADIDKILEGLSRKTSPFTAKDGAEMIDGLFEHAQHIPIWLLSLGNAVVTIEHLEEKMLRLGRKTKTIEIEYTHLAAVATEEKNEVNRELLVIGWDEATAQKRGYSLDSVDHRAEKAS